MENGHRKTIEYILHYSEQLWSLYIQEPLFIIFKYMLVKGREMGGEGEREERRRRRRRRGRRRRRRRKKRVNSLFLLLLLLNVLVGIIQPEYSPFYNQTAHLLN
jgi:hypothetical protein